MTPDRLCIEGMPPDRQGGAQCTAKGRADMTNPACNDDAPSVPEYLKTPEAADYTRLSVPTLDRYRIKGNGPKFAKVGKSVIYRRVDLDAWMASRLVRSTSEVA